MFLFSSLLVVYCRPAMLLLHGGAFCYVAFFILRVLYLKNDTKNTFFCTKNLHISKKSSTFASSNKKKQQLKQKRYGNNIYQRNNHTRDREGNMLNYSCTMGSGKSNAKGCVVPKKHGNNNHRERC